jgi:pre-mRNA-splicing factor 18
MFESQIAHVLNDETQRKYIQGLKRLMTKCQEWYPSDDPAKSVDYIPPAVRHKQHLQNLREDIEEKTH